MRALELEFRSFCFGFYSLSALRLPPVIGFQLRPLWRKISSCVSNRTPKPSSPSSKTPVKVAPKGGALRASQGCAGVLCRIFTGSTSTLNRSWEAPQAAPEALWPIWLLPGAWVEDSGAHEFWVSLGFGPTSEVLLC